MSAGEKIGALASDGRYLQLNGLDTDGLTGDERLAASDGIVDEFTRQPVPHAPTSAAVSLVVFHELAEFLKPKMAGAPQRALTYTSLRSIHERIRAELETIKKGQDIQLTPARREMIDRFLSTAWAVYNRERQKHVGLERDALVEISEESAEILSETAEFTARCKSAALFRLVKKRIADFKKNTALLRNPPPFKKTAEDFESRLSLLQEKNPLYDISAEDALTAAVDLMAVIDAENFKLAVSAQIEALSDFDGALARTRADFKIIGREHDIVPKMEFDTAIAKFQECLRLVDDGEIQEAYALYTEEMSSPRHERIEEFIEKSGRHLTVVNLEIGAVAVLTAAIVDHGLGAVLSAPAWMPEAAWQLSALYMRGITFTAYHKLASIVLMPELSFDDFARNPASTNARNLLVEGAMMAGLFGTLKYGGELMKAGVAAAGRGVEAGAVRVLESQFTAEYAARTGKNIGGFFEQVTGFMGEQGLFVFWEYLEPQFRLTLGEGNSESVKFAREHILTIDATVDRALFLGALRLGHLIASPVTGMMSTAAGLHHRRALKVLETEAGSIIARMTARKIPYADGYARLLELAKKARARWAAIPGIPEQVLNYLESQVETAKSFYNRALEEMEFQPASPRIMGRKGKRRSAQARSRRRTGRRTAHGRRSPVVSLKIAPVGMTPTGLISIFAPSQDNALPLRHAIIQANRRLTGIDNAHLIDLPREDFPILLEITFEVLMEEVVIDEQKRQQGRRTAAENGLRNFFQLVETAVKTGYEMPFADTASYKDAQRKYTAGAGSAETGDPADGQIEYKVTRPQSPTQVFDASGYAEIGTVGGERLKIKIGNMEDKFVRVYVELGDIRVGYVYFKRIGSGFDSHYEFAGSGRMRTDPARQRAIALAIYESFETAKQQREKPSTPARDIKQREQPAVATVVERRYETPTFYTSADLEKYLRAVRVFDQPIPNAHIVRIMREAGGMTPQAGDRQVTIAVVQTGVGSERIMVYKVDGLKDSSASNALAFLVLQPPASTSFPQRRSYEAASGGDVEDAAAERLHENFAPRRPTQGQTELQPEPPPDETPSEHDYPGRNEVLRYSHGEEIPRALTLIKQVLERDDLTPAQRVTALLDNGICLRRQGQWVESINTISEAVRIDNENDLRQSKPHREFAIALLIRAKRINHLEAKERMLKNAESEIGTAIKLEPALPYNHSVRAEVLQLQERSREALVEIEKAIEMHTALVESQDWLPIARFYYIKADILLWLGKNPEALEEIDKALSIRPESGKYRVLKARILVRHSAAVPKNNPAESKKLLLSALDITEEITRETPNFRAGHETMIDALLRLARLHEKDAARRKGFYKRALAPIDALKKLGLAGLDTMVDEVEALAGIGRREAAIDAARAVNRDRRNISKAYRRTAEIMLALGEYDLAIELAERAVESKRRDPRSHERLVEAFETAGKLDEAEHAALDGLDLFERDDAPPDKKPNINHLVAALIRVRLKMGKNDDALRDVQIALDIGVPPHILARAYKDTGTPLPSPLSE